MNKILELREKRTKAWEAAKAFLDTKRGADGMVSAEDSATYEKMESDVVALGKEIERLERQATLDREMSKVLAEPLTSKPQSPPKDTKIGRASDEYKKSFWAALRSKSPTFELQNSLKIGTDSEGGYLVPDEYERTLIASLEEENVLRKLAHVIQTSSGDRKIPVVSTKGSAAWIEEEGPIPEDDDSFGQTLIGAHKLGTMIKISEELIQDAVFDLPGYIAKEFGRRIGNKEEDAFFNGDGSGKPTGIFHKTNGAQLGATTAASTAITADEVIDLFYSLRTPYRKNAVFITNESTVKAIRKLKDGQGQYLWQPSLQAGTTDTILGKRILTSPFIPEIAAGAKTIAFGDFSYYWIADRQGRIFKRLNELYARTDQIGFLATQRVDGKLILPEAIKVLRQKA